MKATKRDFTLVGLGSVVGFFVPEMGTWIADVGIKFLSLFASLP